MSFSLSRFFSAMAVFLALFFASPIAMAQDIVEEAGAAPVVATSASLPELREIGRLKKVFRHEKLRQGIAPEDQSHFNVSAKLMREDGGPIGLWFGEGEARQEIPLGEKGELNWRPSAELFKANPPVFTDVPKGQLSMNLGLEPILPMPEQGGQTIIKTEDMRLALKQANKAMGKAAGLVSFAVPKMKKIIIKPPEGEIPMMHFIDGTAQAMEALEELEGWYVFNSRDRALKKLEYISASAILDSSFWN